MLRTAVAVSEDDAAEVHEVAAGDRPVATRAVPSDELSATVLAEEEVPEGRVHLVPLLLVDSIRAREREIPETAGTVPDVLGQPLRVGAFRLHQAGFRVRVVDGELGSTSPEAGTKLAPGELVRLGRGRGR